MKIWITIKCVYLDIKWKILCVNNYSDWKMNKISYTIMSNEDVNILYEESCVLGGEYKTGMLCFMWNNIIDYCWKESIVIH